MVPAETNEAKAATVCSIQGCYRIIISKSDVENSCLFGALERHRKWLLAFVTEKNKPVKSLKAPRYRSKAISHSVKGRRPAHFLPFSAAQAFVFPVE